MRHDGDDTQRPRRAVWPVIVGVLACLAALAGMVSLDAFRAGRATQAVEQPTAQSLGEGGARGGVDVPDAQPNVAAQVPAPDGAPAFDVVRTDKAGQTIVAGRAPPGSEVSLLVDGITRAETRSDGQGNFVVFASLGSSVEARVMWLLARMGGGEGVISLETVILAPEDGPAAAGMAAVGAPHGLTLSPRGTQAPGGIDAAQAVPGAAIAAVTGATAANGGDPPSAGASVPPAVSVSGGDDAGARDVASGPTPDARPAVAQTRPLISDAAGVRVLDAPPLSSAGAVRLDTLSYGADGAVILQGRAAPGGRVTAQLDGASVGRVNPGADGQWTLRLPGVAPGDYRLDITREDVDGRISDRMTVPFRREAPDVIAAALGLAGARVVTVQPGATLWAIARDRYGDGTRYVQVYEANRIAIANPDLIFPGQVFDLPDPDRP